MHLSQGRVGTAIAVSDVARARGFYEGTLGLTAGAELPDGSVTYECGGRTGFFVYPSQFAGTNQATYMGWEAEDFDGAVAELREAGVTFEEYDFPEFKTVDGVAEFAPGARVAWFKDPDGNILSINTPMG